MLLAAHLLTPPSGLNTQKPGPACHQDLCDCLLSLYCSLVYFFGTETGISSPSWCPWGPSPTVFLSTPYPSSCSSQKPA